MRAESADRQRQRLLRDMGIEFWFLRAAPGARVPAEAAAHSGDDASARPAAAADRPARQLPARSRKATPSNAGRGPSNDPPPAVSKPPPASQTEPAFSVVALGLPGALLVASAFPARGGEARLAQDLIRAARRDWAAGVRQARFDWPLPGAQGSSRPALTAFVEKQAEDFAPECLLATESVASRLQSAPLRPTVIPELHSLAAPDAKRKLWQQLQALGQPPGDGRNSD